MNAPERVCVRLVEDLALGRNLELTPSAVNGKMLPEKESGSTAPDLVDK